MIIYDRGIRRRLAPMFEGDQRQLKMAYSLLFSLPGTPKIVYGDEIGMGEDLNMDGRNSVRCPMQWNAGANAGFSTSKKGISKYVIRSGSYGYRNLNVQAQEHESDSLLGYIRKLGKLRRQATVIGESDFRPLTTGNDAVLAHTYHDQKRLWICVHNLSDHSQRVVLALDSCRDGKLEDLLTGEAFKIKEGQVETGLQPYGHLWLSAEHGLLTR
jgi:maltose alpha-D-glucosyltransferase/alpha-amylase